MGRCEIFEGKKHRGLGNIKKGASFGFLQKTHLHPFEGCFVRRPPPISVGLESVFNLGLVFCPSQGIVRARDHLFGRQGSVGFYFPLV